MIMVLQLVQNQALLGEQQRKSQQKKEAKTLNN